METLIAAQEGGNAGPMVWRPVIDSEILPKDPVEVLAKGSDLNVPVIVGCAQHETDFIYRDIGRSLKGDGGLIDRKGALRWLRRRVREHGRGGCR